ncbi:uncharacterized protein TNIN_34341 [Trichonephila inaurata madagascariensis]|uniref:Uncharacterized protein n=1 Tax=Trichonephila inaurata madagascariensis TaxID=2747483 RepID=A0A8X6XPM2_9ARAC|nr:uncharacterized protein TNIN_71611 [Trichonephila inaurata madagascariensis]GFY57429.1 uncharacterized protein TNIN_34341 [Trichonephila inaurata madagascariensis]
MDGHQAIRLPFLSPIHAPLPNRSQGWCTHFSMILGIPSSKGRWRKRGTRLPLFTIHHLLLPADDQVLAGLLVGFSIFFFLTSLLVYCGQRFLGLFAFGG